MRCVRVLALTAAAAFPLACRDAVAPYRAENRQLPAGSIWQLTGAPGDERTPAWSPDGALVYYAASLSGGRRELLAIPFQGGVAAPLFTGVATIQHALAPDVTADDRVAFVDVLERVDDPCPTQLTWSCGGGPEPGPWRPQVTDARVLARARASGGPVAADPVLALRFEGLRQDTTLHPGGLPHSNVITWHPFQTLWAEERAATFRPSWDPAGARVVFSDGLTLRLWTVGDSAAAPLPGSDDGVGAAWSPTGEWIAYTHLERGDSVCASCVGTALGFPICAKDEKRIDVARRLLMLIRPDGSETLALGEGDEAVWSPDAAFLVVRDQGRLWRVSVPDGARVEIPNTQTAREPALSPDGSHLVFARPTAGGGHDLWVIAL